MPDPTARVALGATGVRVTALGLGGAPLGNMFTPLPGEQARATVDRAWDLGLRWFDTAPLYGHGLSERRFGEALRDRPRDDYALATKVGRLLVSGEDHDSIFVDTPPVKPVLDYSAAGTRRSLEDSLTRLGLERVDVLHVHDPDEHEAEAVAGAFAELRRMRDEGLIGAVGVGMNQSAMPSRFVAAGLVDCVLLAGRYSMLDQSGLSDLLPAAARTGVSVIVGGVFNSGLLADPKPGATFDYAPAPQALVARARRLGNVCAAHGVALRAAALQFPLAHPAVVSVLTGARSPAEVEENAGLFAEPVPASLWDALRSEGLLADDVPTP